MATLEVGGRTVELNGEGYLADFDDWDEDVARTMAEQDNLKLLDCHWTAIRFLREYYDEHRVPASPRIIVKQIGHRLTDHKCGQRDLKEMFPLGGCKHACRLAGLPIYYCHAC